MYHQKAPHRNWMPNVKHLKLFENDTFPLPDNFFDDYQNRGSAAKEQEMEIKEMYLSMDMKLDPESFIQHKENGKGGKDNFNAVKNWQHSYDRMTKAQKEEWDKYYKPISEEFYKSSYTDKQLAEWKYQRYIKDY